MTRVFTWEEVRDGRIPSPEDMYVFVRRLREDLPRIRGVQGAVVCGSVLWKRANVCSDIDVVVGYTSMTPELHKELVRLQDIAHGQYITLQLIPWCIPSARTFVDHIDACFADHVYTASREGGMIGADIAANMRTGTIAELTSCAKQYVCRKLRKLEEGAIKYSTLTDEGRAKFLEQVLMSPVHVVRKVLQAYESDVAGVDVSLYELYCRTSQEVCLSYELGRGVWDEKDRYIRTLQDQSEYPNRSQYEDVLSKLHEIAPLAQRMLWHSASMLKRLPH